jgi:hypothetical protein
MGFKNALRMLLMWVLVVSAACATTDKGSAPAVVAPFLVLNCSGFPYEMALQATVMQGLFNRQYGAPSIWLSDIAEGLGAHGQQDSAGYPGSKFIEWKTGHAGGPWYQPKSKCRTCAGLRERWFDTIQHAVHDADGRRPVAITFAGLLQRMQPLLKGKVIYNMSEPQALGPVLTMAGVRSALPVTLEFDPLNGSAVPTLLDTRGLWTDYAKATRYITKNLLKDTNSSVFAVQAPTDLPYLADAIVDFKMAVFWMPNSE